MWDYLQQAFLSPHSKAKKKSSFEKPNKAKKRKHKEIDSDEDEEGEEKLTGKQVCWQCAFPSHNGCTIHKQGTLSAPRRSLISKLVCRQNPCFNRENTTMHQSLMGGGCFYNLHLISCTSTFPDNGFSSVNLLFLISEEENVSATEGWEDRKFILR